MSGPKPCLGYPSRTAAIFAFRQRGETTASIADRIGISPKTVTALEASAAKAKRHRSANNHPGHAVLLSTELYLALGPHAAKRGRSVGHLARFILETVIKENMVDAVLDDDAEWGNA